jgi:hypothetical protein
MPRQVHKTMTSPAPIGGLNVMDSLAAMKPTDATVLRNFFTQPYGCMIRKGTVKHAQLDNAPVETVVEHISSASVNSAKLFAFANGKMYDITLPGQQARTPVVSGLLNSRWEHIGMTNAAGVNTVLYNGVDNGIWIQNSGAISRITAAVNPGAPGFGEISGVDPKNLIGGCIHQKRMWLVQKDSTKAWYLDPEAITGVATQFDFGPLLSRGGYLAAVGTWTLDSGVGPDDLFVAISSVGQIVIYSGTDPSSVATWQLRGTFDTGAPLGRRFIANVAGDLLLMTQYGLLSMNAAIATSDTADAMSDAYLSQKIQYLLSQLASQRSNFFGWDLVSWPDSNMILINIPLVGKSGQFVQSTITKGWAQWDGINAMAWCVADHQLFYGDAIGGVYRAWEGYVDNAEQAENGAITGGTAIFAEAQTAFNYMGALSTIKHAKMVRPIFINSSSVPYAIRANADFDFSKQLSNGALPADKGDLWGVGLWGTARWSGGQITQKLWSAVGGIGSAFAINIAMQSEQQVLWAAYDFMYEDGTGI